jgi:glycine/D-amino acid oxidase-like deaminating enzyme
MHKKIIFSDFSYWETESIIKNTNLFVIGSGIVGLSAAIAYKEKYKKAKVIVLERGILPHGASTKNAGFACFGSPSELVEDIQKFGEDIVWETVEMRIKGLELLRKRLGDKNIDFQKNGGYELFDKAEKYHYYAEKLKYLNNAISQFIPKKTVYKPSNKNFGFKGIKGMILNSEEGQINTGLMMQNLQKYAFKLGVIILNSIEVKAIKDINNKVLLKTNIGELEGEKVIVATNGFAKELLNIKQIEPARAQVLITKPLDKLPFEGTFHYQEGYYYFRNIDKRVLFGGGRNLDFKTEQTTDFKPNFLIYKKLIELLDNLVLPNTSYEIDYSWCGIMGVGSEKKPIIRQLSPNLVCAVRMGGMGVAIGSLVGKLAIKELE